MKPRLVEQMKLFRALFLIFGTITVTLTLPDEILTHGFNQRGSETMKNYKNVKTGRILLTCCCYLDTEVKNGMCERTLNFETEFQTFQHLFLN